MNQLPIIANVLTIAGSDSGGGAGIQADLKTITALGGFGMTVITAITAQNTMGVIDYMPVTLELIEKQFDAIATDIPIHAAKTGMLANPDIVKLVASKIHQYSIQYCVVDPVMVAKGGSKLLSDDAIQSVIRYLIPVAYVVTPNIYEAEVLTAKTIKNIDDMKEAAKIIHSYGARYVVVKGGHLEEDASDVIYDGINYTIIKNERINTKNTHGTGCTFSAAIATFCAKGYNAIDAITQAKNFITKAIQFSLSLGKGHGPTNHLVDIVNNQHRSNVIDAIQKAFTILHVSRCGNLLESGLSNIAYTLPYVSSNNDIAMLPGGIITYRDSVYKIKDAEFNVDHPLNLCMHAVFPLSYRAAINIKNKKEYKATAHAMGISIVTAESISLIAKTTQKQHSVVIVEVTNDPWLYVVGEDPVELAQTIAEIKARSYLHEEKK